MFSRLFRHVGLTVRSESISCLTHTFLPHKPKASKLRKFLEHSGGLAAGPELGRSGLPALAVKHELAFNKNNHFVQLCESEEQSKIRAGGP